MDGEIHRVRVPLPSPIGKWNMNGSLRRSLFMKTTRRWERVRSSMSNE